MAVHCLADSVMMELPSRSQPSAPRFQPYRLTRAGRQCRIKAVSSMAYSTVCFGLNLAVGWVKPKRPCLGILAFAARDALCRLWFHRCIFPALAKVSLKSFSRLRSDHGGATACNRLRLYGQMGWRIRAGHRGRRAVDVCVRLCFVWFLASPSLVT